MADEMIDTGLTNADSGGDLSGTMDRLSVRTNSLTTGANNFARAMTQAFSRAAAGGKNLDGVLKSLALRLSNMAVAAAFKPLTQALTGGLGNLFGGLSGGGAPKSGDEGMLAAMGDVQPFAAGGVVATPAYFPLGPGGAGQLNRPGDRLLAAMGNAQPFAAGGVVATPTYFPLGPGRMGLAGEAGPEAIMPLARGADGKLGVVASTGGAGANITIHINTPDPGSFRRSETYVTGLIARAVARGQRSL